MIQDILKGKNEPVSSLNDYWNENKCNEVGEIDKAIRMYAKCVRVGGGSKKE